MNDDHDDDGFRPQLFTKVTFNKDDKYDLQLGAAEDAEHDLANVLQNKTIELKTEEFEWEQTGNIAIEFERNGKPSGIEVTQADFWVHELRRNGKTLMYLWFPIARLYKLAKQNFLKDDGRGKWVKSGGDGGTTRMVLISLRRDLFL